MAVAFMVRSRRRRTMRPPAARAWNSSWGREIQS
jgi:hypothetical protein